MLRSFVFIFGLVLLLILPSRAQETTPVFPIQAGSVEGAINNSTPSARYSFTVAAGQTFIVRMETTSGDLDPFLLLFSATEQLIESNDDETPGARNAAIEYTAENDATFIVETTRFQQEAGTSSGTYRLTLSIAGDETPTEVDPLSTAPEFGIPYRFLEFDSFGAGVFEAEGGPQYFALGGRTGDLVQIVMAAVTGDLIPEVAILDADRRIISRVAEVTDTEMTIYATLPADGWYLIEAGRSSGTGSFTIYARRLQAALISPGETITGRFSEETSSITYVFNGTLGDRVFATVTSDPDDELFPELTILDLAQMPIASRQATISIARVRASLPRSGTYLVQARSSSGNTGEFALSLTRFPLDLTKISIEEASYNRTFKGELTGSSVVDYYRFSGKADELVTIGMRAGPDSQLDPLLILSDAELTELAYSDNTGGSRDARIAQFALPADGEYIITAARSGMEEGNTSGSYDLELTAGRIILSPGIISATLNWEGSADLNLFVRAPSGRIASWSNPILPDGGRLQIDSNTRCETPSAQPVEHIYWPGLEAEEGDYTVWVWYQNACGLRDPVRFSLTVNVSGEALIAITEEMLNPDQRFEATVRMGDAGAAVFNPGSKTTPTAQQRASQGGDTLIFYGQTMTATINDEVYARFYQFRGREGETVIITAERVTGDLDPIVVLRDDIDRNLAEDDDGGEGQNARLEFTLPTSGTYTIAVTRYGLRDGTTVGDYRLTLTRQ